MFNKLKKALSYINLFNYYQNKVIVKYLNKEVFLMLLAVILVLFLVLVGNQFINFLKKAYETGIPPEDLLPLISLKVIRDFVPLLPLALFLAIIIAVGRLYRDSEAIVLNTAGLNEKHFMLLIQPIVIAVIIIVSILALIIMPWSKLQSTIILEKIKNSSQLSLVTAGKFHEFNNSKMVFYAGEVSDDRLKMKDVFINTKGNEDIVIIAKRAEQKIDEKTANIYLHLQEGKRYHNFPNSGSKKIINFNSYNVLIHNQRKVNREKIEYNIRAIPSIDLIFSDKNNEKAELQWRISQPLSAFLLSLIAILFSKSSPRQGSGMGLFLGLLIYILYNNLLIIAKSSLEKSEIPAYIGLWWVHLLMVVFIYFLYNNRQKNYLDKLKFFHKT